MENSDLAVRRKVSSEEPQFSVQGVAITLPYAVPDDRSLGNPEMNKPGHSSPFGAYNQVEMNQITQGLTCYFGKRFKEKQLVL